MIKSLSDLIGQDDIIVIGIDIGFRTTGFVADRLVFRDGKITEEVIWCDTFKTDANAKKRHIYVADDDIARSIRSEEHTSELQPH